MEGDIRSCSTNPEEQKNDKREWGRLYGSKYEEKQPPLLRSMLLKRGSGSDKEERGLRRMKGRSVESS